MKKGFLCFLIMVMTSSAFAQKPVLNHIAYYVYDLKTTSDFYQHVIGLDTIPEPFHDGKHIWFQVGPNSHLHLIAGAKEIINHEKNSHLCFSIPSVEKFIEKLDKAGISYEDWPGKQHSVTNRVDGVKQIYFKDPDGRWIEINDAK
jgi:lactoylglutathione lyase